MRSGRSSRAMPLPLPPRTLPRRLSFRRAPKRPRSRTPTPRASEVDAAVTSRISFRSMTHRRCRAHLAGTSQLSLQGCFTSRGVDFAVLGPVAARHDGRELPLGGPKQRAVLAMLLLRANQVVSRERLIDGLWGARPPPTAAHTWTPTSPASERRSATGGSRGARPATCFRSTPASSISSASKLCTSASSPQLLGERATRRRRPCASRSRSGGALLLQTSSTSHSPQSRRSRLEERRLSALEDRIDADLALGAAAELVAELEHSSTNTRSGSGCSASRCWRSTARDGRRRRSRLSGARQRLAEELGLEPGPSCRGCSGRSWSTTSLSHTPQPRR